MWSGYPCNTIDKYFNIFLKENNRNLQNLSNVPRKQIYFGFQYINESSEKFVQNISKLISKNFSFVKCIPYFKKGRNLLSFFLQKLRNSIEILQLESIEFLVTTEHLF